MAKYCPANKYEDAVELAQLEPEAGLELLETLIKKYPSDPSLRHACGVTLLQLGEAAEALPHLEQALKRQNTLETHTALMLTYAELGMERHARRAARRVRDLGGDAPDPDDDDGLDGDVPVGAKDKDLLAFERARFDILHGKTKQGLSAMMAFSKRFPNFQPALNNLATGYFVDGQLAKYREAATRALDNAPENIHALLNYARLELLELGPEALETLKSRILNAPVSLEDGLIDGELAAAQALALFNDDEGIAKMLKAWNKANRHIRSEIHPVVEWLEEHLHARTREGSEAPYFSLSELIPGQLERWYSMTGASKKLIKTIAADLQALPGFLKLIPAQLGFEDSVVANLVAALLLELDDIPEPFGPWTEVLKSIALNGPGKHDTRAALLILLKQEGLVDEDEAIAFAGMPEGVDFLELEISFEAEPSVLSNAEMKRMEKLLNEMRKGKFAEARAHLEPLVERYPDDATLNYNMALCELYDKSMDNGKKRAYERLDKLVQAHPNYLFAKAQLATEALEVGNLKRAHELLQLPKGLKRIHVQEYATFISAQGRLALAEGEREQAEKMLEMLDEMIGADDASYIMLERALNRDTPKKLFGILRGLFEQD